MPGKLAVTDQQQLPGRAEGLDELSICDLQLGSIAACVEHRFAAGKVDAAGDEFAAREGFTRIALGHHRDDIIETFFLNLFNGGRIKAMPPKLLSDDGRNVVIRPLAYCAEKDIRRYAQNRAFPIIPCNLCGSQPNLQRQAIKAMLGEWKKRHPGRIENIFRALGHVSPSQLADRELFDFAGLGVSGTGVPETSDWTMPERKRIELNVIN